jgi:hypothetical protein
VTKAETLDANDLGYAEELALAMAADADADPDELTMKEHSRWCRCRECDPDVELEFMRESKPIWNEWD